MGISMTSISCRNFLNFEFQLTSRPTVLALRYSFGFLIAPITMSEGWLALGHLGQYLLKHLSSHKARERTPD
jgi:hypothetical protein